jgi:NAD(P)-dependent dehydrogenase (short-subunit alcohol dehydrogenase family)
MESATPRHAVVTGASSGIGRAITERLLRDGWRVTGIHRGTATVEHAALRTLHADLADAEALARALVVITDAPDAVVHAAGVLRVGALGARSDDDAATMWRVHVDAATRIADALVPRMAAAGRGRMVLIGSRVSGGMPGRGDYAATKAAMVALARSWAAEVVAHGVTVNVVSPAATDTAMLGDPSRAVSQPKLPPLGRLIKADEVAALVAFLLSDDAAAITGQEIMVCAGASLAR